jgi:prevent-host-death family protein
MGAYSVAQAKAHMSALLLSAERGEEVTITRRGLPIVQVVPLSRPTKGIDWERVLACQKLTASTPQKTQACKRNWATQVRALREAD